MAFLFGCRAAQFLSSMRPMPFAANPALVSEFYLCFVWSSGLQEGGRRHRLPWQNCSNYHPIRYLTALPGSVSYWHGACSGEHP